MKQIANHQGYWITKTGQVWSDKSSKYLKPYADGKGYLTVKLTKSRQDQKNYKVHRLVAEYYLKSANPQLQVNHIDGDKKNNEVNNLEWVSGLENIRHSWRTGLHKKSRKGSNNSQSKLTESDIPVIRERLTKETLLSIARDYGVDKTLISQIKHGKAWKHV